MQTIGGDPLVGRLYVGTKYSLMGYPGEYQAEALQSHGKNFSEAILNCLAEIPRLRLGINPHMDLCSLRSISPVLIEIASSANMKSKASSQRQAPHRDQLFLAKPCQDEYNKKHKK